jgi:hypothetical protein
MRHAHQNLNFGMDLLPDGCRRFKEDHKSLFYSAQGSSHNHQAWLMGYADHIEECFGVAGIFYAPLHACRILPFTLADALLVLFLHDIEKLWKHSSAVEPGEYKLLAIHNPRALQFAVAHDYNIVLTDEHWNALDNIHGELDKYSKNQRVSGPLGAFCHMCDYWSARGWYDEPLKSGALWGRV